MTGGAYPSAHAPPDPYGEGSEAAPVYSSRDGENLDLVIGYDDEFADCFAGQRASDRGDIGNRSVPGIGFVLAYNAEALSSTVVALERHMSSKGDRVGRRRGRDDLSRLQPFAEILQVTGCGRAGAATLVQ